MEGNRHPFDKLLEELLTGNGLENTLGISIARKSPEEVAAMVKAKEAEAREKTKEAMVELAGITGLLNKELKKNKIGFFMRKALLPVFLSRLLGGND